MSKMPDKYDRWTDEELLDQIITKANQVSIISESNDLADLRREALRRLERSAFPPPAEDAKALVKKICAGSGKFWAWDLTNDEAELAVESFAQSRVEPWREALRNVDAWITEYNMHWRTYSVAERLELLNRMVALQDKARALLSDSPAKEKA